jgi:hypothetical protein
VTGDSRALHVLASIAAGVGQSAHLGGMSFSPVSAPRAGDAVGDQAEPAGSRRGR